MVGVEVAGPFRGHFLCKLPPGIVIGIGIGCWMQAAPRHHSRRHKRGGFPFQPSPWAAVKGIQSDRERQICVLQRKR